MKVNSLWALLLCVQLISACSPGGKKSDSAEQSDQLAQNFNLAWADSSYWDDGLAEVAEYSATRTIYKKGRNFTYTLLTVAEQFNQEFNVKTDDYSRKDLYSIMKHHSFASIATDNYPYHFSKSVFLLRNEPFTVNKANFSSQEWCGNTFKEFRLAGDSFKMEYNSYFDGEGKGGKTFPADMLFEDQLSFTLRALRFKDGAQFRAKVLGSQISNKVGKPEVFDATFFIRESDSTFLVRVKLDSMKENLYEFEKQYPNTLLSQNTWDNRNLRLTKVSRYAYWKN